MLFKPMITSLTVAPGAYPTWTVMEKQNIGQLFDKRHNDTHNTWVILWVMRD